MVFFDLSVPYLESDAAATKDNAARKAARLKVVVKAMELGYTGVAYDRIIRGVMSDKDRCTIPPFPFSSLLKVAPTLSASVKFHRELLGVPVSSTFRQYRRLTVAVDSVAQASALNSGNPVLKTYDLVAARPLNQTAFDQACAKSEVDLIAIDFSQRLPFRLKLPMIKAAIERGVYFEITYSHLIANVNSRTQMLSSAKLLVDWTRGKNLIFSSAATSADEVRGPYDIANLSSLLGLSTERAKAAISKSCRHLLDRALRKKQFYQEAIRIEKLSPAEQLKPEQALLGDWSNWDPISSGEGDLPPLDDFTKFFSDAIKVPKTNFNELFSVSVSMSQQNLISCNEENLASTKSFFAASLPSKPSFTVKEAPTLDNVDNVLFAGSETDQVSINDTSVAFPTESCITVTEQDVLTISDELDLASMLASSPTCDLSLKCGLLGSQDRLCLPEGTTNPLCDGEKSKPFKMSREEAYGLDEVRLVSDSVTTSSDHTTLVGCTSSNEGKLMPSSEFGVICAGSMEIDSSSMDYLDARISAAEATCGPNTVTIEKPLATTEEKELLSLGECKALLKEPIVEVEEIKNPTNCSDNTSLQECNVVVPKEPGCNSVPITGVTFIEERGIGVFTPPVIDEPLMDGWAIMGEEGHPSTAVGVPSHKRKGRFIQKLRHQAYQLPSKGLFKPLLFKRKPHNFKESRKNTKNVK